MIWWNDDRCCCQRVMPNSLLYAKLCRTTLYEEGYVAFGKIDCCFKHPAILNQGGDSPAATEGTMAATVSFGGCGCACMRAETSPIT